MLSPPYEQPDWSPCTLIKISKICAVYIRIKIESQGVFKPKYFLLICLPDLRRERPLEELCCERAEGILPGGAIVGDVHEGVHDQGDDQLGDGGRRLEGLLREARRDPRVAEGPEPRVVEVVGEEVFEHRVRGGEHFHHPQLRVYVVAGGSRVLEAGETGLHDGRDPVHPLRILCQHLQQDRPVLYQNLTDIGLK